MNPVTHLLIGWSVASPFNICRRERAFVTIAGIVPDIDGAGIILDFFSSAQYPSIYEKYHHVLGHNIGFALLLCLLSLALSKCRLLTTLLIFFSFHIHLLGDLIGSRGPDGYQWPISYLLPFTDAWQLTWQGQWELNAWPNFVITFLAVLMMFYMAWKRGISPLEIVSEKANNAFVAVLRNWIYHPLSSR